MVENKLTKNSKLRHDNILECLHCFATESSFVYIFPLIHTNLLDYLLALLDAPQSVADTDMFWRYLVKTKTALQMLHENGLCCLNLDLESILVCSLD